MAYLTEVKTTLDVRWCSPLAKIFCDAAPVAEPYTRCAALRGEAVSFQLAYHLEGSNYVDHTMLKVESPFGAALSIRQVKSVAVDYPGAEFDEDYIRRTPGLYPDVLQPIPASGEILDCRGSWNALWFKVAVPKDTAPGTYTVKATIEASFANTALGALVKELCMEVEVLPAVLPEQTLKYTNWFHCDCLSSYYGVQELSEEHWRIIGNFMKTAADHGMNMILTPIFTPPLDTEVGGERPTVQLVDVAFSRGKYTFRFEKLSRWFKLAAKCGIRYFEMAHLFTQWGARATPKIIATVNGKLKRIFGWDVASDSREYTDFLEAFLPALTAFLRKSRIASRVYFHCSDEPNPDHLDTYAKAVGLMRRLLPGFKIMDALSHVEYFHQGLVTTPVPLVTKLEEFIAAGVPERWTYTCCGPATTYTNRFIAMSSSRNRVLGAQLYYFGVEGFLHWGFDFYYKRHARGMINPYVTQSSDGAFPAGDPFVVYPGFNGEPLDSLRLEVFSAGLQDQRVMQLLESRVGRPALMALLDGMTPGGHFTMADYPRGEKAMLALREGLNRLVRENFA